jgi:hypothetical protein
MHRNLLILGILILLSAGAAAQDKLAGRWEGTVQSMQGERPSTVIFKKDGEIYTGRTTGLRPGMEIQLKDVRIDGNKVMAKADVETPQAAVTINYTFTLEGETMKGQGALEFGGNPFTFDISLKRTSSSTEGPLSAEPASQAGQSSQAGGQRQRVDVPQPQQKQSIDYFVGQWTYKYIGRESGLGPAPRDCTVNFTKRPDGKSVEGATSCKHDNGTLTGSAIILWDESARSLSFTENLGNGVTLTSKGDWSSPIAIRFVVDPVKTRGQALQLRRTITIVAAHSFSVTEELSENGGPFVRLGSAVYAKSVTK